MSRDNAFLLDILLMAKDAVEFANRHSSLFLKLLFPPKMKCELFKLQRSLDAVYCKIEFFNKHLPLSSSALLYPELAEGLGVLCG